MARQNYHKLIRDRLPDLIVEAGGSCRVTTLAPDDFVLALRAKLVEEAQEAASAEIEHLLTELADLQEVIKTLLHTHGWVEADLAIEQHRRWEARGGFEQRLQLLWVEKSLPAARL